MDPQKNSRINTATNAFAQKVVRRLICRSSRFRGHARNDGRLTLLTVDYYCRSDIKRLLRSYRKFVSTGWPAVVVANSGLPLPLKGARVVGLGRNLLHGIGLDFGMRFVSTEYVLVCDPDSIIAGDLWGTMKPLVDTYGVASIDGGWPWYHPICLAFRTSTWKEHAWSFQHDWDRGFDVGGGFTAYITGLDERAAIPRTPGFLEERALLPHTRGLGPTIEAWVPGKGHQIAEVYGDVFSNTHGVTRIFFGREGFRENEGTPEWIESCHQRWREWADEYLEGRTTLDDFPS